MNIKITKGQAEKLDWYVIDNIEFGNPNGQDKDFLKIVAPNPFMDSCIHNNDHFLHYKCEDREIDSLYATPRMIVNALVTGKSDLPYKLLVEGKFSGTSLSFVQHVPLELFDTFKMAKCLLGVAERDLKQKSSHDDPDKKQKWVNVYVDYVEGMLERSDEGWYSLKGCTPEYEYIKWLRSFCYSNLPRAVNMDTVTFFNSMLNSLHVNGIYMDRDLEEISMVYYKNWLESL